MYADAALVVGRSPAEQPVAAAGGLEAGRLPDGGVTDGLYVVMCVQAHARRAGRSLEAADHGRLAALANDLYVGTPQLGEVVRHRLRRRLHVAVVLGLRAHRRDRDEPYDIVDGTRNLQGDSAGEIREAGGEIRHGLTLSPDHQQVPSLPGGVPTGVGACRATFSGL